MLPRRVQEVSLAAGLAAVLGCARAPVPPIPAANTAYVSRPSLVRPSWTSYVVQAGDTLGRIAACSGASVLDLAQVNQLANPDFVLIGARLRVPGPHECDAPRSARGRAGQLLAAADARLDGADFERALSLAESCVQLLESGAPDPSAREVRARCHVVAGMAAAGLDRRERAIGEFRQAFLLDPTLELAAGTTSPRILDLVSAARPAPAR
jgi:LysM repeat protein